MDMLDALRRGAARGRIFLQPDPGPGLTYAEALSRAGSLAAALVAAGVKPATASRSRLTSRPMRFSSTLPACAQGRCSCRSTPLYPAETRYFLQDAEVRALSRLGHPRSRDGTRPAPGRARTVHDIVTAAPPVEFADAPASPDTLAAILYTSGTTGRSKGVMLSRANLATNAETLASFWAFTPDDVLLHALPIFHTHGLFVATNTLLVAGASMIFLPAFSPDAVLAALPRATTMMGVPTFYTRLLADPRLTRDATAHIRLFISGSAPLSAATHREWETRTARPFSNAMA